MGWAPQVGSTGARCCQSTYCVQDWAGGTVMAHSTWPKQMVPQEMAGTSQIDRVRYGISHFLKASAGLGTAQKIITFQQMGCQGASVWVQGPKPRTQQDLLELDSVPLASPVPQSCRAKGLFHPGIRKNWGLALSQLQNRIPLSSSALHVSTHPMLLVRGPGRQWGVPTFTMYSLDDLWQVTFLLSSNISSLGHPGPSLQPTGQICHQFAGLSPSQTLVPSGLSSLLSGQLSGFPGFHSKNLAKQTGFGHWKQMREILDQSA